MNENDEITSNDVKEIDDVIKKKLSNNIPEYTLYILRTFKLMDVYNSFFSSKKIIFGNKAVKVVKPYTSTEKDNIIKTLLSIFKEYINVVYKQDNDYQTNCEDCNSVIITLDDLLLCSNCGRQYSNIIFGSSFKDCNRVNLSGSYSHDREHQFNITIQKYQGLHTVDNGAEILKWLQNKCIKNNIKVSNITTKTIHQLLSEGGYKKMYSDIPWFKWHITGIKPNDISEIEQELKLLFRKWVQIYYKIKNEVHINYPNNQYMMIRFIMLINHPKYKETMKTLEETLSYERICEYERIIYKFCKHYNIPYNRIC